MDKKHVYITVNGQEVEYKAISLDALKMSRRGIERSYRERGEPIDPPTYEIVTGSGAKVTEIHDETTVTTDEERAAWDAYRITRARIEADNARVVMRYILDDGLEHIKLPEDASWQEKYKARYIEVPTDPQELRDFYITTEVLPSREDVRALTNSVLLLSEHGKVDPDALEARLEMFRGGIRRQTAPRIERTQKQMEAQPETNGN